MFVELFPDRRSRPYSFTDQLDETIIGIVVVTIDLFGVERLQAAEPDRRVRQNFFQGTDLSPILFGTHLGGRSVRADVLDLSGFPLVEGVVAGLPVPFSGLVVWLFVTRMPSLSQPATRGRSR